MLFFELILIFALVKKCTKLRCCATIILDVIVFTAHDRQTDRQTDRPTDRPTDRQTDGESISLCNFVATRLNSGDDHSVGSSMFCTFSHCWKCEVQGEVEGMLP